jgi:hypothetical protein
MSQLAAGIPIGNALGSVFSVDGKIGNVDLSGDYAPLDHSHTADQIVRKIRDVTIDTILILGDDIVTFTDGETHFIIVTPDSFINFPIGAEVEVEKTGIGDVSVMKGDALVIFEGPLGNNNVKIDGEAGYSIVLRKVAANTWRLSGNMKAY